MRAVGAVGPGAWVSKHLSPAGTKGPGGAVLLGREDQGSRRVGCKKGHVKGCVCGGAE